MSTSLGRERLAMVIRLVATNEQKKREKELEDKLLYNSSVKPIVILILYLRLKVQLIAQLSIISLNTHTLNKLN